MPRLDLREIAACPRCVSPVRCIDSSWACTNQKGEYAIEGFPTARQQPVLVDFAHSMFRRSDYDEVDGDGDSPLTFAGSVRTYSNRSLRDWFRIIVFGLNTVAARNAAEVQQALKTLNSQPRLLIISGGTIGEGTKLFYQDEAIQICSTDVYPSPNTSVLADAHSLPFADHSFDGVWIQAVLEHVLEPHRVVEQIHRVLKPGGVVYAETPFMMPVHEAAHDFTRFTLSGHRWLFRRFSEIHGGVLGGGGSATLWSIRFFWRALGLGDKAATLLTLPFFWLRYCDALMRGHVNADAALGIFFFGRKAEQPLQPEEIIAYYRTQDQHHPRAAVSGPAATQIAQQPVEADP